MKSTLTIGLIGTQFMGKAHSNAYRQVGRFFDLPCQVRMKTICGRNPDSLEAARAQYGWEGTSLSWREVIADPEIDVVDISTPGDLHAPIAIAAAQAGKAVWCEKPMANTLAEAEAMASAVREAGVHSGLFHCYRMVPAVALARQLIEAGELGEIRQVRMAYLQDWLADAKAPFSWRVDRKVAGSGAHGDLNSHLIDLARFLVGDLESVCGLAQTFTPERTDGAGTSQPVTVDDATLFLARFACGATGSFEASRVALGRKNANRFEINGSLGSLAFDLELFNELHFYSSKDAAGGSGFRRILLGESNHPYAAYWPVGHGIGYEHVFINWVSEAVRTWVKGEEMRPNFEDGLACQRVLDAVDRSCATGAWTKV